ncbi:MAG: TraR/DksA C4-type zinc finger protein, partial [Kiritimatiellae bacterium]|nr:TraR/DksA C4-type zinc finger protein [Kiritimatiellia bacterium]
AKEPSATPPAKPAKKAPKKPAMKKMVVKAQKVKPVEDEFVNNAKDFAFAIAESMKNAAAKADLKAASASAPAVKLSRRPTTRKAGKATLKFSASDLAQFRKSLIALREQVVGKTTTLRNVALEQTIDRVGEDEDGSDSFMRLQNLGQVDEQNKVIQKIDEALRRIEDGSYGICEICGQLIRKPRLLNLPFVHTCMECQCEMESGNR